MNSTKLQGIQECIMVLEEDEGHPGDGKRRMFRMSSILNRTKPFMYWDVFEDMLVAEAMYGPLSNPNGLIMYLVVCTKCKDNVEY